MSSAAPSVSIDRLRNLPLFADLDEEALGRVAMVAIDFEAPTGRLLVEHGEAGSGLFLLEEGSCVVEREGRTFDIGPGEFVGELSLFDETARRTARVRVTTPVRGVCIQRDDFTSMLAAESRIALAMLRALARRLAEM